MKENIEKESALSIPKDDKERILEENNFQIEKDIKSLSEELDRVIDIKNLNQYNFETMHQYAEAMRVLAKRGGYDAQGGFQKAFEKYVDLLYVDRTVEIMNNYNPSTIDTIAGIDRSGRSLAKLVKYAFDAVRQKMNLQKTNLIFLNLHNMLLEETDIRPSYKQNKLFVGRNYGNLLAIDDLSCQHNTRELFYQLMERMEADYHTDVKPQGYIYFLEKHRNILAGLHDYQPVLLLGGEPYLDKAESEYDDPALLSVSAKDVSKNQRQKLISSINEKASSIGFMSAEIYERDHITERTTNNK